MYSVDYPGRTTDVAIVPGLIARHNFAEFMRVKFDGNRPQGAVSGSRVSPFYDWHVTLKLLANPPPGGTDQWSRDPDGGNEIGQGHLQNINDILGGT
jgi:hypothetical protein